MKNLNIDTRSISAAKQSRYLGLCKPPKSVVCIIFFTLIILGHHFLGLLSAPSRAASKPVHDQSNLYPSNKSTCTIAPYKGGECLYIFPSSSKVFFYPLDDRLSFSESVRKAPALDRVAIQSDYWLLLMVCSNSSFPPRFRGLLCPIFDPAESHSCPVAWDILRISNSPNPKTPAILKLVALSVLHLLSWT